VQKFLAPPYYSHRAVFASPVGAFFHYEPIDYKVSVPEFMGDVHWSYTYTASALGGLKTAHPEGKTR